MRGIILVVLSVFFFVGCGGGGSSETEAYYCDTNEAECLASIDVVNVAYLDFCSREASVICTQEGAGDSISSTTASSAFFELQGNYTYMSDLDQYGVDDYWHANSDVNVTLIGDHCDKSVTLINSLIYDGGNPGDIKLIASGTGAEVKHYYVEINGLVYNKDQSYDDIFYMSIESVGVWRLMNQ